MPDNANAGSETHECLREHRYILLVLSTIAALQFRIQSSIEHHACFHAHRSVAVRLQPDTEDSIATMLSSTTRMPRGERPELTSEGHAEYSKLTNGKSYYTIRVNLRYFTHACFCDKLCCGKLWSRSDLQW
jgi:hypothetical protein